MAGVTYVWLGPEWLTVGAKYCPQGVLEPGFDVPEGALPVKALEEYVEMGKARKVVEQAKIVHRPAPVAPPPVAVEPELEPEFSTDTDTDTDADTEPKPKAKKKASKRRKKRS